MDVIILKEALKELSLRAAMRGPDHGYLLGRKVGQTVFVDRAFVAPWRQLLKPEVFFQVEKSQLREIVGVFSLKDRFKEKKQLLRPLFCEKIYLELKTSRRRALKPVAQMIKFEGRFFFEPLGQIILEMEEADV